MKKYVRTVIALILIVSFALGAVGCGGQKKAKTTLEVARERGTLLVGCEGAWPPFIYNDTNDNNKLVGFEVEWAQKVAEKIGLKAEFNVSSQWDGVVAGLDAHRYDVIFEAVAPTDQSVDKYSYSNPYYVMRTVLVVAKDDNEIKTFADLKGKITGNSPQGVWAQIVRDNGGDVRNMNLVEAMDNIVMHRIDAAVNSELAILDYLKTKPDAGVKIAAYYDPPNPNTTLMIALFNKGNDELIAEVNKAIHTLLTDGTANALSIKYFGKDIYEGIDLTKYEGVVLK
jgi:L-cystine transport system substrate-binding protein